MLTSVTHSADMPKLVEGLRLLNQADSCVETLVQETGEHVILTAGELHLERCLRDLRERFAKIEIQASPPIVPFRETAIQAADMPPPKTKDASRGTINGSVLSGAVTFTVRARPLPSNVTKFLINNMDTVRRVVQSERDLTSGGDHNAPGLDDVIAESASAAQQGGAGGSIAQMNPTEFWKQLDALFATAGKDWADVTSKVWAFGPRRIGPNILVDRLPGVTRSYGL
jgi:ribosome assembly protein 1